MTAKTIEFYFDFGSPAAYLAATQLPHIAADTGATLVWKPMLLGACSRPPAITRQPTSSPKGRT